MGAQLEPGAEQVLLSSSGDRTACTWDLRKLGPGIKSLASASASNTILSAYYSLDGEHLIHWPSVPITICGVQLLLK